MQLVATVGLDPRRSFDEDCWLLRKAKFGVKMEYGEPQGNKGS